MAVRIIVVVLLLLAGALAQAAPPAFAAASQGTSITTKATVTFTDGGTGYNCTLDSNVVKVIVKASEALTLTPDHTAQLAPGAVVQLAHKLTNTGNTPTLYTLDLANGTGDDYDLSGLLMYRDLNQNGKADPGDPLIANGGSVTLAAGSFADVVVTGVVPPGLDKGLVAKVELSATSAGEGANAINVDTLVTEKGVAMRVLKAASTASPAPGETFTYTITATNVGDGSAAGVDVTVDGAPGTLVVLSDAVPPNTTLVSLMSPNAGTPLYHGRGDPDGVYSTAPPADLSSVDSVGYGFAAVGSGISVEMRFTVRTGSNASGSITNTAKALFFDPVTGVQGATESNRLVVYVPGPPASIRYYTDGTFTGVAGAVGLGRPLYIQLDAAGGNTDSSAADTITVVITSSLTGDSESFEAVETGPNTGVFRISGLPTADGAANPANPSSGTLETKKDDMLTARFQAGGGGTISAQVLVDPYGIVFDSRRNTPLSGATVTLIDVAGAGNGGNAGGPARVFLEDGVTPAPSTVVTGADGKYVFPRVAASTYRLQVTPPAPYSSPSSVPTALLPAGRYIDPSGSYGGTFAVTADVGALRIDVPLDSPPPSGFFIDKTASRTVAEIADFVEYNVRIKNGTDSILTASRLVDDLPAGFAYVGGTAFLNGAPLADPAGGAGPRLTFSTGTLAIGGEYTVSYRARVTPGASAGDNFNSAQVFAASLFGPRSSNVSQANVRVQAGVFTDRGIVFGKVFVDGDGNGLQSKGEPGIPGVRLYLDDGTFVITDEEGKYSIYGISARTHVLRIDRTTLPEGAVMRPVSNRHGADGLSAFVDLKKGELHKTDFAEGSGAPEVAAQITQRRAKKGGITPELDRTVKEPLRTDAPAARENGKSKPSSGIVGGAGAPPDLGSSRAGALTSENSNLPGKPVEANPSARMETLLPGLTNELDFVNLKDGDTLPSAQMNILVKGTLGAPFRLTVNGREVPAGRVGTRSRLAGKQLEVWEYIGVDMSTGTNLLELAQSDDFGNVRGTRKIAVHAPGRAGKLRIDVPKGGHPADGKTPITVTVAITDRDGVPVTARTPVTLELTSGSLDLKDPDPKEPGVQAFIEGGAAQFDVVPPAEAVGCRIRATSGALEAEENVPLVPALRPLIVVGVVEGSVNFRTATVQEKAPPRNENFFEDELRGQSSFSSGGSAAAGVRGSVFAKGKIGNGYLLTASYDSEKGPDERMFRDIQPDEYFPVYGDSSIKGYDAQSTSALYLRIDKGRSSLLYGDFTTACADPDSFRVLGAYSRSLTGGRLNIETDGMRLTAYASKDRQRQMVDEIGANGTSGPYLLRSRDVLVNSEKVEILVRDRNQPSLILKVEPQARFTDYVFDVLSGGIVFKQPIFMQDQNLNPLSVRVTYEIDQGGPDFWIEGADVQLKLSSRLQVGGTWGHDENPQDPFEIMSGSLVYRFSDKTYAVAEYAGTNRQSLGQGNARRFEIAHDDGKLKARIFSGYTDAAFDNPTASLSRGRSEGGFKGTYQLDTKTRLVGEAVQTEDVNSGGAREGYRLSVERALGGKARLELGIRHAQETSVASQTSSLGAVPVNFTSVRAKVDAQWPGNAKINVFGEYEQDLQDSARRVISVGGDYQFAERGRFYARHDLLNSLSGRYALNPVQQQNVTQVGIDTDYMKNGRLVSEYRVRDAISGREAEAAIGLRNQWDLGRGVRLETSFERVRALSSATGDNDQSAVTGALEFTGSPTFKGTARCEYRLAPTGESFYDTLGVACRLNDDLTFLGKDILNLTRGRGSVVGDRLQNRLLAGVAYRPVRNDALNGLFRYEYRYEKDDTASGSTPGLRRVGIIAADVNYQVAKPLTVAGYYAYKDVSETVRGAGAAYTAQMLCGRVTYDINPKWDVGILGGTLFGDGGRSRKYAWGLEAGSLIEKDLWLSAGYNFMGFDDQDLSGENYTNQGPYVRLRFKFGEDLFGRKGEGR